MPSKPSSWVARFAPLIPKNARVLDLASGSGRHTAYLLDLGLYVTAVDIDVDDLRQWAEGSAAADRLKLIQADLEDGPWPVPDQSFDAVVVTNYLYLPIMANIADAVADGGVLIYETFGQGNEAYGRPSNPDYLLAPGALTDAFGPGFQVVAYEHGVVEQPHKAVMSRICSVKTTRPITPPL